LSVSERQGGLEEGESWKLRLSQGLGATVGTKMENWADRARHGWSQGSLSSVADREKRGVLQVDHG
jgi:hypothetical protein